MTQTFDLLDTDLSGVNLIEASAGTGKTFTIAAVYLRLIIETGLTVDGILVVTFTEAATAELKDRIRNRLRDAVSAFEAGGNDEPFLQGLIDRHPDPRPALDRLRSAIRDFDEAAIFTIHGFCMRMLRENAFESGGLFDTELMTNEEGFRREVVEDFWRRHFYEATTLFVNHAVGKGCSPDFFLKLLGKSIGVQTPRIIPRVSASDTAPLESDYRDAYRAVAKDWPASRQGALDLLMATTALNLNQYKKEKIPLWVEEMDAFTQLGSDNPAPPESFLKFTHGGLRKALKKNQTLPTHPFFSLCDALADAHAALTEAFDARLLALKIDILDRAGGALREKKARRNRMAFDDLLLNLQNALSAEGGPSLAATIRSRFKAALIDEFQDTDPIQYDIFRTLFSTPGNLLFLIGDPKQAIYRFRGADIFAYMEAKEHAERRFTLGENWRSEPGLVHAVNAVYGNAKSPFLYDAIPFEPATPAENKPNPTRLTIDGEAPPPMQIWRMVNDGEKKAISKTPAREVIIDAAAAEIARLIALGREGRALINDRPLAPGDIAVLLRAHYEARAMQRALFAVGVSAVLHSTENLFDARETAEMETVMAALARPGDVGRLRTALATDMLGLSVEEIDALNADEAGWEFWLIRFRDLHDLWARRGFMRAFRELASGTDMLPRLMALPDGERRCTNLLHLAETLHAAEATERPGMSGLVKWLSQQRQVGTDRADEHLLRLESDARAVRLVTIHKSKGLEYPVVFCPFIWAESRSDPKDPAIAFHDEADRKLTLDLGSDKADAHRTLADKENLAENLRLLYVALTRARNRCVTVWGKFNRADTAAAGWVFHPPPKAEAGDPLSALSAHYKGLDEDAVKADLDRLAAASKGVVSVQTMPAPGGSRAAPTVSETPDLTPRAFTRRMDDRFRVASFSSLTRGGEAAGPQAVEIPDHDAAPIPMKRTDEGRPDDAEPARDIFSFPRGAGPGTFLHSIFETIDFTQAGPAEVEPMVADMLASHGFEPDWRDVVVSMIQRTLATPLLSGRPDFTLSRVSLPDRLTELGFYFPLRPITPDRLAEVFDPRMDDDAGASAGAGDRLRFEPTEGFMMGFMDLVFLFDGRFYLLDWKSNHLGDDIDDYRGERLNEAMRDHHYDLQYYLYSVALDRYLRTRMPDYDYDAHFGGVFYLFLRGMDPARGVDCGVFYDRPSASRIAALSDALIDADGAEERMAR